MGGASGMFLLGATGGLPPVFLAAGEGLVGGSAAGEGLVGGSAGLGAS